MKWNDISENAKLWMRELGVVRSLGFGRCEVTSFGDFLVAQHFEQSPSLPLKTSSDFAAQQKNGSLT